MLTRLPNGNSIRLADIRSIKVSAAPVPVNGVPAHLVDIRFGESFEVESERLHFASKEDADRFAEEIAGKASGEQAEEFDRIVERDARRVRDRRLDRVAAVASGIMCYYDPESTTADEVAAAAWKVVDAMEALSA